jgi:hypothetical protein
MCRNMYHGFYLLNFKIIIIMITNKVVLRMVKTDKDFNLWRSMWVRPGTLRHVRLINFLKKGCSLALRQVPFAGYAPKDQRLRYKFLRRDSEGF